MSVDVSQPPPLKRLREYTPLSTASSVRGSKCGELFVSKNADKWTFCCSHCQKVTNDIGVFICHIRLDHLNGLPTIEQEQQPPPATPLLQTPSVMLPAAQVSETPFSQENINLPSSLVIQSVKTCSAQSEIFNEEEIISETNRPSIKSENISEVSNVIDISSMSNDNTDTFTANQDISTPTNFPSFDNTQNKEFFTITSIGQAQQLPIVNPPLTTTLQTHDQEIVQVVYLNNDTINGLKPETINIEETDDENYLTISDTDDDFDEEDDENVSYLASTSANVKQTTKDEPQLYRCPYCHLSQKDKYETFKHIEKFHPSKNRKMLTKKCKTCGKCFRSDYSLKVHKKLHTEKILKECKICSIKIMKSNYINHILKHESHDCFPCQVCGKILKTNEERIAHSKNHIEENPFVCDICLRRFKRKSDLESHLMSHKQYSCSFCPAKFNTINRQKSPYACPLCRKVPDIMNEVERQHNLANIYHVFDSDREEFEET